MWVRYIALIAVTGSVLLLIDVLAMLWLANEVLFDRFRGILFEITLIVYVILIACAFFHYLRHPNTDTTASDDSSNRIET